MKRILLVLFVLIVGALAASPFYFGQQAEDAHRAQYALYDKLFNAQSGPGAEMHFELRDYHRGWMTSEGEAVLSMNMKVPHPETEEKVDFGFELAMDQQVFHGPFPLIAEGDLTMAKYVNRSSASLIDALNGFKQSIESLSGKPAWSDDSVPAEIRDYPPMTMTAVGQFDGSTDWTSHAEPFVLNVEEEGVILEWTGSDGSGEMSADFKTSDVDINFGDFSMTKQTGDRPGKFSITGMRFGGQGTLVNDFMSVGYFGFDAGQIRFDDDAGENTAGVNDFGVHVKSDVEGEAVAIDYAISVGKVDLAAKAANELGDGIDGARLEFGMRGFDLEAYGEMVKAMNSLDPNADPAELQLTLMPAMMNFFGKSLQHNPSIRVSVKLDTATLEDSSADVELTIKGVKLADVMANPMAALAKLSGTANLSVSTDLVKRSIAAKQLQELNNLAAAESMSDAEKQAQADAMADQMLGMVLAQGMIEQQGGLLVSKAQLSEGMQLVVNGNPIPLGALMQ